MNGSLASPLKYCPTCHAYYCGVHNCSGYPYSQGTFNILTPTRGLCGHWLDNVMAPCPVCARINELQARITELLAANNAEVEKRRLQEADANQEYAENILLRNECMRQRARAERLGDFIEQCHDNSGDPIPEEIAALIEATFPAQQGDKPLDVILAVAAGIGISESQLRADLNIKLALKGTETE